MRLRDRNHPVQAFPAQCADDALAEGIHLRAVRVGEHDEMVINLVLVLWGVSEFLCLRRV